MRSSVQDEFRRELSTLKDGIIEALASGRTSDVRRGFAVYERLFMVIVTEGLERRIPDEQLLRNYEANLPQWRWLNTDLIDFGCSALEVNHFGLQYEVIKLATSLLRRSLRRGHLAASEAFFDVFGRLWLESLKSSDKERFRASLLDTIYTFSFVASDQSDELYGRLAAEQLLRTLVRMLKDSLSHEQLRGFTDAVECFDGIYDNYGPAPDRLGLLKEASRIALIAWVLRKYEMHSLRDELALAVEALTGPMEYQTLWRAYQMARSDSVGWSMRWDMWELELLPPRGAGILSFTFEIDNAAALAVAKVGAMPPSLEDVAADSPLRLFKDAMVRLADNPPSSLTIHERFLRALSEHFDALIGDIARRERDDLRAQPLDGARIQKFANDIATALLDADRLSLLFRRELDESSARPPDSRQFGINTLVPREFFAAQAKNAMDPGWLADDLAASLIRGENGLIVESLRRDAELCEIAPDEIAIVAEEVTRRMGGHLLVIISNSLLLANAVAEVIPREFPGMHHSVYTEDGIKSCLLIDLSLVGHVHQGPISPRDPESWLIPDEARVAVSVIEYAGEREEGSRPVAHVRVLEELWWVPSDVVHVTEYRLVS